MQCWNFQVTNKVKLYDSRTYQLSKYLFNIFLSWKNVKHCLSSAVLVRVSFFFLLLQALVCIATTNSPIFYCFGCACFWLWLSRISCILCLSLMHAIQKLYPEADCIQMIELLQTIRTITINILSVNLFLVASSLCLSFWSGIASDVLA